MKILKKRKFSIITFLLCIIVFGVNLVGCGAKKFDANKNITVMTREDGSGTKSAFMEILGLKGKKDVNGAIIANGTAGVLAEIENNPYAICYESLGYVTENVKKLKVNGVDATIENIKNGDYKIARPLQIVYQESALNNKINKAFYNFLQSSDAQTIISEKGYVSLADNAERYIIDSSISSGTITISGSTSLQPLMIELANKFKSIQSGVEITVAGGGSGTGYSNAKDGVSNFGMISEEFNSAKAPNCQCKIVAKDGIAIIINKINQIENISLEQLKNVYDVDQKGNTKIKTWSQVNNEINL